MQMVVGEEEDAEEIEMEVETLLEKEVLEIEQRIEKKWFSRKMNTSVK